MTDLERRIMDWHVKVYGGPQPNMAATTRKLLEEAGEVAEQVVYYVARACQGFRDEKDRQAQEDALLEELADVDNLLVVLASAVDGSLEAAMEMKLAVLNRRLAEGTATTRDGRTR